MWLSVRKDLRIPWLVVRCESIGLLEAKQIMRQVFWIAGLLLLGSHDIASFSITQEAGEQEKQPGSSKDILVSTRKFERAVNGNAIVRNRCRVQGKDIEIEETAEVIRTDGCKLVVRARKVTSPADARAIDSPADGKKTSSMDHRSADDQVQSAKGREEIEFIVYADLSELTTPVLLETQKFGQCEAGGAGVLKVSSRSEPGKGMQVIRRSEANGTTKEHEGVKQTRRDLSLFFSVPATAEKARKALELAVKSCGGNEWPDEDDLP